MLQGVFTMPDGGLRRGLTTLSCALFTSEASLELDDAASTLTVSPTWKTKALRAALVTAEEIGFPHLRGVLNVRSSIEVGCGFGSSTSDVTATIRATLDAFGVELDNARIARLAVLAESAADPLMFDDMLLFAHREGLVIESFEVPLPAVAVLGFPLNIGPVDTLTFPRARYNRKEIHRFDELRLELSSGALAGDLAAIGRVATESARINQRFLPIPHFKDLLNIAENTGAVGLQIAHSGSIGGFLFAPGDPGVSRRIEQAEEKLQAINVSESWYYLEGFGKTP
ncbi:GHMP kinase [Streptomyces globisporus]|uniref:GHMP family kinase ATP-binding protein n=1 Tax=Streptomyces globisporus TaxID=1908 RepID=UPI0036D8C7AB